jgi:protein-L-isoaspartate(D-aspartate) O-methyltransferase
MNTDLARFHMIEQQIRPWDVLDTRVLALLSVVKREQFVPPAQKALAFVDMEIPLISPSAQAMAQGKCMLAPRVEARMLQDLEVRASDRVLEIGTGSGYMAALLGASAQHVLSLEEDAGLAATARQNLSQAGIHNVDVQIANGAEASAAAGLFDVIVLSGSVAEVPEFLRNQLQVGGRLMAVVGDEPVMRATLVTRTGPAAFNSRELWDTVAPRLHHFAETEQFSF